MLRSTTSTGLPIASAKRSELCCADQMATLASLDNGEAAARDSDLPENGH